jgi:hypothetical protein
LLHDAQVDTKQFIASLVSSAAWPVAVFGVALLFRKQIAAIIAVPVKRLKAGPVELEFERVLPDVQAKLAEEAEEAPPPEPAPPARASRAGRPSIQRFRYRTGTPPRASESAPSTLARLATAKRVTDVRVRDDLAVVAPVAPGSAVISAHARLHRVLRELVGMYDPKLAKRSPVRLLADFLVKERLISPTVASAVQELTALRNLVAHDERPDTLSPTAALAYLDLVDSVIAQIGATFGSTDEPPKGGNTVATGDTEPDSPASDPESDDPENH